MTGAGRERRTGPEPAADKRLLRLIAAMTVLALAMSGIALHFIEASRVAAAGENLALSSVDIADKLDRVLFERYSDIQVLAETPVLQGRDPGAMAAYLTVVQRTNPAYVWIGVVDAAGRIVAATDPASVGQDRSDRPWFHAVRDARSVHVQDAQPSEDAGGVMAIGFTAPLKGRGEEFRGAVTARVELQVLEDVFARTVYAIELQRGASAGIEWQFLNRNGDIILDSLLRQEMRVNLKRLGLPSAGLSLEGAPGYVQEVHLHRHVPIVTGYAKTGGYGRFTGLEWGVLVSMDRSEILAPLRGIVWKLSLAYALVFVPMLGILFWATRRLMRSGHELARKNAELVDMRDQALQAARSKAAFLSTMSHEIRTPMNGVIGMTGMLRETELTEEQREYVGIVQRSGEALLAIINDILDFSKNEAGKLHLECLAFDLCETMDEVMDVLAERAQAKGLELVCHVGPDVPTLVRGGPGRIRQILTNLVGNAIKFTERGEVVVRVEIEDREASLVSREARSSEPRDTLHERREMRLRFSVTDTGIGLTEASRAALFQPFSQADDSITRKYGGTGLGLAICKQLATAMGGEIGVASEPGRGSTFWFTLRLDRGAPDAVPPSASDLRGVRVCVVDDHEVNRRMLEACLKGWGVECASAADGPLGLAALRGAAQRGQPCDAAILDMHMPGMSGLELAQAIRGDVSLAGIRLVLLTSWGQHHEAEAAKSAGVDVYLTKPVRHGQLRRCLALLLAPPSAGHPEPSASPTDRPCAASRTGPPVRVLVAEDNVTNQKVAARMLAKLGCRVDVVANGLEAVAAQGRMAYDVILMDCQMPDLDGLEATRRIRARERSEQLEVKREQSKVNSAPFENATDSPEASHRVPVTVHVPIIALTATVMPEDREKCLAAGMDDFLSKPVKLAQLNAVLDRWLSRSRAGQAAEEAPCVGGSAAPPDGEALDPAALAELRELAGEDDPEFVECVFARFIHDATVRVAAIREAVRQDDAKGVRLAAHSLKGNCGTVGATRLARLAADLQQLGDAGDLASAALLTIRLGEELTRVTERLSSERAPAKDAS